MIVFIPRTDPDSNPCQEPDWEWLPRICPGCGGSAIGHGRRTKQAHGSTTRTILCRRGCCRQCSATLTVLPAWSLPYTHYRLEVRHQSVDRYVNGASLESAAPTLEDANRAPDNATLRRWFQRRLQSLCCWLRCAQQCHFYFQPPTILAWDWKAALRILIPEPSPG